jgi:HTH domain
MKTRSLKRRVRIEERRKTALAMANQKKSTKEIAQATGTSRMTVWRDFKVLAAAAEASNVQGYAERRQQQGEQLARELEELKRVAAGSPEFDDAMRIEKILAVSDRIMRLWNLGSTQANVNVNVAAEGGRFLEFCRHSHGIAESDWPQVWAFMDSLPRETLTIDASYYPPAEDAIKALPDVLDGDSSHHRSHNEDQP